MVHHLLVLIFSVGVDVSRVHRTAAAALVLGSESTVNWHSSNQKRKVSTGGRGGIGCTGRNGREGREREAKRMGHEMDRNGMEWHGMGMGMRHLLMPHAANHQPKCRIPATRTKQK